MTFSVYDKNSPLAEVAEEMLEAAASISQAIQANGYDVTIFVTKDRGEKLDYALLSTIEDDEELVDTVSVVSLDMLEGYVGDEDGDIADEEQPELPFGKVSLQ